MRSADPNDNKTGFSGPGIAIHDDDQDVDVVKVKPTLSRDTKTPGLSITLVDKTILHGESKTPVGTIRSKISVAVGKISVSKKGVSGQGPR